MEANKDFKELLALFNAREVDYMIVGAHALAFHGSPRYTGDLDIFVRPDEGNGNKILQALNDFGFGSLGLTLEDVSLAGKVVQLGYPPLRIDLVTSITGISWDEAAENRVRGQYGDVPVFYLGKSELIRNKKTLARKKDLADIEALGEE